MKHLWWAWVILLVVFSLAFPGVRASQGQEYSNTRVARLSQVEGQVQVSHPGSEQWEDAVWNLPLQEGDTLATASGLAEVEFENGATAYLAENSVLVLTQLVFSGDARLTQLKLTQGAATFYANPTSADSFRVVAPTFEVAIPERAEFRLDAFREGAAVEVLEGSVSVSTREGSTSLEMGQSVSIHEGDFQKLNIAHLPDPDEFDHWVTSQSETIHAGTRNTLQYVSAPNYGLSDLSIYGTWVNFPGYGNCWKPFGAVAGWAPFLNGNWILDPRLGWVWVSSERWGWLPYHYGSWLLTPSLGWLWVPGGPAGLRQWQPARVNFFHVGNQTAWVAKSPEDREGIPANIARGVITRPATISRSGPGGPNQIIADREFRSATPLKQPPTDFARQPAMPPRAGSTSELRSVPQPSNNAAIVFDHRTHTFINGEGGRAPAISPAPMTPQSMGRPEGLRGSVPPTAPIDSPINRVNLPPPYPVSRTPQMLQPSIPANQVNLPPRVNPAPPLVQRASPAPQAQGRPPTPPAPAVQQHSSAPQYGSVIRPAAPAQNESPTPSTGSASRR
jgi:hypothetical protein